MNVVLATLVLAIPLVLCNTTNSVSYCQLKAVEDMEKCTLRIDIYDFLINFAPPCKIFGQSHCICNQLFNVEHLQIPPYIFLEQNSNTVKGILADIIGSAVGGCCMNCSGPTFLPSLHHPSEFSVMKPTNSTVFLPVLMYKDASHYMGLRFQPLISTPGAYYITLNEGAQSTDLAKRLLYQVVGTWPLLAISLLMALTAGVIIWMLDTWFNLDSFPRPFSRGVNEGFWWAFISMTTVGYGDRCPKSTLARVFAITWIFFGVTVTGMFVATLTSALTRAMILGKPDLSDKQIGVLSHTSYERNLVLEQEGNPELFSTISDLMNALLEEKIEGLVIDKYVLQYHWNTVNRFGQLKVVSELHNPQTVYGMAFPRHHPTGLHWASFLSSFFENNKDNEKLMIKTALKRLPRKLQTIIPDTKRDRTDIFVNSREIRWYLKFLLIFNGAVFLCGFLIEILKVAYKRGYMRCKETEQKSCSNQDHLLEVKETNHSQSRLIDDLLEVIKTYETKKVNNLFTFGSRT